jgi:hypothetical protein
MGGIRTVASPRGKYHHVEDCDTVALQPPLLLLAYLNDRQSEIFAAEFFRDGSPTLPLVLATTAL